MFPIMAAFPDSQAPGGKNLSASFPAGKSQKKPHSLLRFELLDHLAGIP